MKLIPTTAFLKTRWGKLALAAIAGGFLFSAVVLALLLKVTSELPKLTALESYDPPQVSEVFSSDGKKIGEYFKEKRKVVPYAKIPKRVVQAFISAEGATFFEPGGVNYFSILRAAIANFRAGHTVQGGSTITQQVAKSFLLSPERTLTRKAKEFLLAHKIESNLTKEQILFLYLNQIYLGQGSYGVDVAAENYFRKDVSSLTLAEAAILAGLPQAPSRYSPIHNPVRAKERQRYVLSRMAENHFITKEEAQKAAAEPVRVYMRESSYATAPFVLETIRQTLSETLGDDAVNEGGLKIQSTIDLSKQLAAEESLRKGLRDLDKRQGFRGPVAHVEGFKEVGAFLEKEKQALLDQYVPYRTILADGTTNQEDSVDSAPGKKKNIPSYLPLGAIVDGVVTDTDDRLSLVFVRFADSKGIIDLKDSWATRGNKHVSAILNPGDVIRVKLEGERVASARLRSRADLEEDLPSFASLSLDQEPLVDGAVISFDVQTGNLLAMAGGYDYEKKKFNHALQAYRQTGSAFKPIIYAAALDHGYTPATVVYDAPLVFGFDPHQNDDSDSRPIVRNKWQPVNYEGTFSGDVIIRTALAHSMNVPTIRILDSIGVDFATTYARRLGIFSPLNADLTMGLGSSSVSLFELTRSFETFAKQGKRPNSPFIQRVISRKGAEIASNITLESRVMDKLKPIEDAFEQKRLTLFPPAEPKLIQGAVPASAVPPSLPSPPVAVAKANEPKIFFEDPEQVISPQTAYLVTSLMKAVVNEGTGVKARELGRPLAGKTGSTTDFHDSWFVGFSPEIITGVWTGFDEEKSLGRGETGANVALPIWMEYMDHAHAAIPPTDFPVPPGIVFTKIELKTGQVATTHGMRSVEQAFLEGTEPGSKANESSGSSDFFNEDRSD